MGTLLKTRKLNILDMSLEFPEENTKVSRSAAHKTAMLYYYLVIWSIRKPQLDSTGKQ